MTELRTLGRIHNFEQFLITFKTAKEIGFENISADLIYGIPGQSLQSWEDSLQKLLDLQPSHASLYSLTIEEGTPYAKMVAEGVLTVPEDDLLADMYEMASEMLENHGFEQYEISNWAIEMDGWFTQFLPAQPSILAQPAIPGFWNRRSWLCGVDQDGEYYRAAGLHPAFR